jgi:hypothetical protein
MRRSFVLTAIVLATAGAALAQSDHNTHLWLNYVGNHPIKGSGPWGLHLETQVRRAEVGADWQQFMLRTGVSHNLTARLSATVGYAYVKTYPYGDFPARDEFPEHRIWEQLAYTHSGLGLEWQHRFRLEQRHIGELAPDGRGGFNVSGHRFENRIRYMLRTTFPLTTDKKNYVALWDEVFYNFGDNVVGNHFDQNRAFVGYGRRLDDANRLEVGFLEQTIQRRGGRVWERNHTFVIWFLSRWPLGK